MPYPNVGVTITGGSYTTKTLALASPMWTKKGKIFISIGDQPGVALGVVSNKIMGFCKPSMCSNDVKGEGAAWCARWTRRWSTAERRAARG